MANEKRLIDPKDFLDLFYVASAGQDKAFVKTVEMVVEDTPTVDAVEVVHGRWEDGICTMCGYPIPTDSKCDFIDEDDCLFCYHCGAKMKGINDETN